VCDETAPSGILRKHRRRETLFFGSVGNVIRKEPNHARRLRDANLQHSGPARCSAYPSDESVPSISLMWCVVTLHERGMSIYIRIPQ
jgi:hypothetical protein